MEYMYNKKKDEVYRLTKRLIHILNQLSGLYSSLINTLLEESKIILSHSIQDINRITNIKEGYIFKIRLMDEDREKILNELSMLIANGRRAISLKEVVYLLKDRDDRNELFGIRKRLLLDINRANDINEKNKQMINRFIDYFNEYFNFFKNLVMDKDTYLAKGVINTVGNTGSFISKEA